MEKSQKFQPLTLFLATPLQITQSFLKPALTSATGKDDICIITKISNIMSLTLSRNLSYLLKAGSQHAFCFVVVR